MKTKLLISGFTIALFVFFACNKGSDLSTVNIRMTDAPGAWQEVNIDLEQVQIKFDKDSSEWLSVKTYSGIYNLLGLQNGIDSLIATGTYPSDGTVKEIRLIVGSDNTIMVNGKTFNLTIPSGSESGLKIKINKKLRASVEDILIDFDAALSIKEESDGYKLRPVVRLK